MWLFIALGYFQTRLQILLLIIIVIVIIIIIKKAKQSVLYYCIWYDFLPLVVIVDILRKEFLWIDFCWVNHRTGRFWSVKNKQSNKKKKQSVSMFVWMNSDDYHYSQNWMFHQTAIAVIHLLVTEPKISLKKKKKKLHEKTQTILVSCINYFSRGHSTTFQDKAQLSWPLLLLFLLDILHKTLVISFSLCLSLTKSGLGLYWVKLTRPFMADSPFTRTTLYQVV